MFLHFIRMRRSSAPENRDLPESSQWKKSRLLRIRRDVDAARHVPSGARHVVGSAKDRAQTGFAGGFVRATPARTASAAAMHDSAATAIISGFI